jgi:NADH-quinone oxidoreductase subunit H
MILVSFLTVIMFFGGWAAPLDAPILNLIPGVVWLLGKVLCILILFLWFRATFPRYRYDQIMRLGWKVFIPVTLVWLVLIAAWMQTPFSIWR